MIERTNSWQNAHKKLLWFTERRARVVDFWMALSETVVIVGRLVREGWKRFQRWEGLLPDAPDLLTEALRTSLGMLAPCGRRAISLDPSLCLSV